MNRLQQAVLEFNRILRGVERYTPVWPDEDDFYKQLDFLKEEINEMVHGYLCGDPEEMIDGAVDTLYVLLDFFNLMRVDLDPLFDEVQSSNMTKYSVIDGEITAIIKDGKIQKGPNYRKPDLAKVLPRAKTNFRARIDEIKNHGEK